MPQVEAVTSGIGFGFANNSSNQATIFLQLKPLSRAARRRRTRRSRCSTTSTAVPEDSRTSRRCPANPPAIPGLGSTGGFAIEIEDINNLGLPTLNKVGNTILAQAQQDPDALAGALADDLYRHRI